MSNAIPPIAERTDAYEAENDVIRQAFRILEDRSHGQSVRSGFWDDEKYHPSIEAHRSYQYVKLGLVSSEAVEAQEELRSGHAVSEIYFNPEKPNKPEGVLPELADSAIRTFDFTGKYAKRDELANALIQKAEYNATREKMHGRKF